MLGNLIPSSTSPTYQANCPWPMSTCAVFSSVADSSGSGQYYKAPNISIGAMATGSGFTMCTWFKFAVSGSWARIFDFGNGQGMNNLLLADQGGQGTLVLNVYMPCANPAIYLFPASISYGTWRHVCIANQGGNWYFYDNGTLVGSQQQQCTIANVVLNSNYLGRSNWVADALLQGSIAEFRIYNRILLGSEVATLYANNGMKQSCVISSAVH